ncbi:MAG: carboxypeptidase regulatory-like domain-containing protein [Alphaproteobacteria bacterium]|nr:carboxypeptidase regulatory-like domain-containing protein [Alphaproteobacteria bacterium]
MRGCRRWFVRFLALSVTLVVLMTLGCAGLYLWVVTPTDAPHANTPTPQKAEAAPPGAQVVAAGVVTFKDGTPAPGVVVAAAPLDAIPLARAARTDDEGRFSFTMPGSTTVLVLSADASPPLRTVREGEEDEELRFVVPALCDLELTVRVDPDADAPQLIAGVPEDPDLQPLEGAQVHLHTQVHRMLPALVLGDLLGGRTDAEGLWQARSVPCQNVPLQLSAEGYASPSLGGLKLDGEPAWTAILSPAALIDGEVRDRRGAPIAGALVVADDGLQTSTLTDADGAYSLWTAPARLKSVTASADDFEDEARRVNLAPGATGATLDFTLDAPSWVQVHCAGLPGDRCDGLGGFYCTRPLVLLGERCSKTPGHMSCLCPDDGAVIRGGGKATRVAPGQQEVWLDFTQDGGITGALQDAEGAPPASCEVTVMRAPDGPFEDAGRGFILQQTVTCDDAEGAFEVSGLVEGTWRVLLRGDDQLRVLPEVVVRRGQVTDVGEVRLDAGGVIDGVVLDGLTGDLKPGVRVALGLVDDTLLTMPVNIGKTDPDGRFRFEGVEPEDYRVFALIDPMGAEEVSVADGAEVSVTVEIGDDASVAEAGLTLYTGGAGELVIGEIAEGSAAAAAGVQEGDVVVGVELLGKDMAALDPDLGAALLSRYGGPGLTLVVDRGGRRVVLDL